MRIVFLFIIILSFQNIFAQKTDITKNCDCDKALNIKTLGKKIITTPLGRGSKNEFRSTLSDSIFFSKENYSVWYYFNIEQDGKLAFEIAPSDTLEDYDFMLFKYDGSNNFCNQIKAKKIKPVRTNKARNDFSLRSRTGLSINSSKSYVPAGLNGSFSKAINVKKGERYYLIINNLYNAGNGHSIDFFYTQDLEISGKILNEITNEPIKAEVSLEDIKTGKNLTTSITDKNGVYELKTTVKLPQQVKLNLSVFADNFFFKDTIINTKNLKGKQNKIQIKMPPLKVGNKYNLSFINFEGDKAVVLPRSYPTLRKLLKFMQQNNKNHIRIEGHTNGLKSGINTRFDIDLSKARAVIIKNFLTKNKILKSRIEVIGYGCSRMIFPTPKNEIQEMKNRRVEIRIIKK